MNVRMVLDVLETAMKHAMTGIIAVMLLMTFYQVVSRYVFHHSLSYSEELARFLFVWMVFLGFPVVARQGGHMAVGFLVSRLRGGALRFTNILALLLNLAFMLIMTWQGYRMIVLSSWQTSPALGWPMSAVYWVIPVGCGFMVLCLLVELFDLLKGSGLAAGKEERS